MSTWGAASIPWAPQQLDIFEAIRQRELAMERITAAPEEYFEASLQAIRQLARSRPTFCADDVRAVVGDPPTGCSPNVTGAAFLATAKTGEIEPDGGSVLSGRVIGHGNRLLLWRARR